MTALTWRSRPLAGAGLARFAAVAVTVVLLLFGLIEGWFVWSAALGHAGTAGLDFTMYQERTRDAMAGAGFYLPHQLAGPYTVMHGDSLYPPMLLYLTVPFALGLPAVLWWAIPLGILGAALWRPAWWAWPVLAALLVYPRTWTVLLYGNPSMWAFAFLAAGVRWHWPAALVPLKLTLAPFALVGIRHRSWWAALGIALTLSIPFGLALRDWIDATLNARSGDLWYVVGEWPIALAVVVASRRVPERHRADGTRREDA